MKKTGILFPHQLFEENVLVSTCQEIYLVEEWLFFRQYYFHQRKIAFHRASMKFYADFLASKNVKVFYIEAFDDLADIRKLIPFLKSEGVNTVHVIDPTDDWLTRRLAKSGLEHSVEIHRHQSPLFLNTSAEIAQYFKDKRKMFQTDFYKHQRQIRHVLIDANFKPAGGKWTFDDENRLKYPKSKIPPTTQFLKPNSYTLEAIEYTKSHFAGNYGSLNQDFIYSTTHAETKVWLADFFKERFFEFGPYEDAIVTHQNFLHHSVLTPMLNVGLITPQLIIEEAIRYANQHKIPLNSLEGFVRQIMGWREFIRAVYELKGREERTKNYWGFKRKIPESFWKGTTGIDPVDETIKKVLETGYCHHIERLMVLGNFMLLCEFDPDEVYHWFMALFIDAYDWVMVPNVYGMSQFADGGLMATKPYISGSNYLMKMSDYKKGDWQPIWDGLFWRFMHTHRSFFLQNPRLGMLVNSFDKMDEVKRSTHLANAENFLKGL